MSILSTKNATWRRGKKTQGIKAKALINLLTDRSVCSKFLIDTLEGRESIDPSNVFCIGGAGDPWQQTSKALLKKYDVKAIDSDGWMICEPKPENEVEFFEIADAADALYIQGLWGENIPDVGVNLQRFTVGDFVCRQLHDHQDQWVVRRTLFLNTYTELV